LWFIGASLLGSSGLTELPKSQNLGQKALDGVVGMAKRKSLAHQLKWAVFNCYSPGTSRRKIKEELRKVRKDSQEYIKLKAVITSKGYRDSLIVVIQQFTRWLKNSGLYSDFKYVYELDGYIWLEFLRYLRNERGYSRESIRNYIARVSQLEKCCKATYSNSDIDFEIEKLKQFLKRLKKDDKIRSVRLSFQEYKAVLQYLMGNHSRAYQLALLLQATFGLRSFEASKLKFSAIVDWDGVIAKIKEIWAEREKKGLKPQKFYVVKSPYNMYLMVKGKGGQWRFVPALFPFQKQILEYLLELKRELNKSDDDFICHCSTSSMRRELKRILVSELGFNHYKDVPSSTHMLRKTWARLCFQYIDSNKDSIERVVVSPAGVVKL
jgi:integrase